MKRQQLRSFFVVTSQMSLCTSVQTKNNSEFTKAESETDHHRWYKLSQFTIVNYPTQLLSKQVRSDFS